MRDSEVAIGGLVLLGVIGAFLYFLFPNTITGLLRGPSYAEIIRNLQSEVRGFNHETKIVDSYLQDSWTMKVYRKIDSALGRGSFEGWTQRVKAERDALVSETLGNVERERRTGDSLSLTLESQKSIRDSTKGNGFKLARHPLDSKIDALNAALGKKRSALLRALEEFNTTRRSLNQKALAEWFHRSLPIGLVVAAALVSSWWAVLLVRSSSETNITRTKKAGVSNRLSFVAKPSLQSGLIKPVESPVLPDSAFHFSFEPEIGPVPEPIAEVLGAFPKTQTASKLASILGGYPDTPASRSHHLSDSGGLVIHTAKVLKHSERLLAVLPDPRIGPVAILAHDVGKVLTLRAEGEGRPHDIPSADLLASFGELRAEFDETAARSMIIAIRHQHSKGEMPLNAPPLAHTILQFIKKADLAASAEESREAAESIRALVPKVIEVFPYLIPELNVNSCMGGKAEGYLSEGHLFLCKEPVKERLFRHLDTGTAPVSKGQDPVWNEMALALSEAGLIATRAGTREAGRKSCLFTLRTSQGQEKAIAIPVSNVAPSLIERWLQAKIPAIEVS